MRRDLQPFDVKPHSIQRIETLPVYIGAHSQRATSHREERTFTPGGTTRGKLPIVWVRRATEHVVVCFAPLQVEMSNQVKSVFPHTIRCKRDR